MRSSLLVALLVTILLLGLFHAFALLTDGDSDGAHLYHGWLIVQGELSLYGDSMTGHRTPFSYWWIGLSQAAFGPSLLAGRIFSLIAGWAGMIILWLTAHRALGERAGLIALCLMATQAYVLGHFAVAAFHGVAFFWVAAGAWFLVASPSRWRRHAVILCAWGLFLTRPQFGLIIPITALWALYTASHGQRVPILGAAILPGGLFLAAYWPDVLKMAAYVPGFTTWAAARDWVPVPMPWEPNWGTRIWRAGVLLLRSYKAWIVLGISAWAVWPVGFAPMPKPAKILAWTTGILVASQLIAVNYTWKVAVGYFPAFALLAAVPLAARLEQCLRLNSARWAPQIMPSVLGLVLLVGPAWSPPPNLPLTVDWQNLPVVQMQRAAAELHRLIPEGTEVFLYGPATALHEAGLRPPVQPPNHLETLVPLGLFSYAAMTKSGLWGLRQISEWLATDPKSWAIVWRDDLAARPHLRTELAAMTAFLDRSYELVETVEYHGIRLEVWRKKP